MMVSNAQERLHTKIQGRWWLGHFTFPHGECSQVPPDHGVRVHDLSVKNPILELSKS